MKKNLLSLLLFLSFALSLIPQRARALVIPPVGMFQLPWQLGESWIAMDGFDNGKRRLPTSPHNYLQGGAVDFAPHVGMKIGEDTSNTWVAAAADGIVFETSYCHIKISHANGWTTEYYHLGNLQVKVGDAVARNQKLAIIDNNANGQVCVGNLWPGPHLHFVLRPNMRDATLAGWLIQYDPKTNVTTFHKNGDALASYQPILNSMDGLAVFTPTPSLTPDGNITATPDEFATPTPSLTQTPLAGTFTQGEAFPPQIFIGESTLVTLYLYNLPPEGIPAVEFTCAYDPAFLEVSAIADAGLFGADTVMAMNTQSGIFIAALAGSNGRRAFNGGAALTFMAKGLQAGQTNIQCQTRISSGGGLVSIPTLPIVINVQSAAPQAGELSGAVFASKPVTVSVYEVRVYEPDGTLVTAFTPGADGFFRVSLPAGMYIVTAAADGFLEARGLAQISAGQALALSPVTLPAGDIDGNQVIDQFDALTIGMNYNAPAPSVADLNNDGVINVLDLEMLALNYHLAGSLTWQ